ncbi:MAG: MFS transporter [Opitutales bacterium]|nr:MFS transporter [Opitutales bacterium]
MILVDRKGRKFLLTLGTSGIIIGLIGVATLFFNSERKMVNCTDKVPVIPVSLVETKMDDKLGIPVVDEAGNEIKETVVYDANIAFPSKDLGHISGIEGVKDYQVKIVYTQGEQQTIKTIIAKEDTALDDVMLKIKQAKDDDGAALPFEINSIEVGPLPSELNGWLVVFFFAIFIASFAVGPGVCVWLALSELMPTRIRATGMSIALLINQGVSTVIAGTFLPVVGNYGYSTIFFFCAGCTVIYWITAVFFLPETKGKRLEQIEAYFEGDKNALKD